MYQSSTPWGSCTNARGEDHVPVLDDAVASHPGQSYSRVTGSDSRSLLQRRQRDRRLGAVRLCGCHPHCQCQLPRRARWVGIWAVGFDRIYRTRQSAISKCSVLDGPDYGCSTSVNGCRIIRRSVAFLPKPNKPPSKPGKRGDTILIRQKVATLVPRRSASEQHEQKEKREKRW